MYYSLCHSIQTVLKVTDKVSKRFSKFAHRNKVAMPAFKRMKALIYEQKGMFDNTRIESVKIGTHS
jgi:hypothetical protein